MEPIRSWSGLRRHAGLRAGLIIGVAFALVGAVVGTATGAVTPFQQVVIVNSPASPIPVTGTVNVTNLPATQPVSVTNFPVTQPVSGTVNIGNAPAAPVVTKIFADSASVSANEAHEFAFGRTINVSTLIISGDNSDDGLVVDVKTASGALVPISLGSGGFSEEFALPVPAAGVRIFCANLIEDCLVYVSVFGT